MIGVCGCILSGASMVIRPKFSASKFASDLVKYECTTVQYIGEFARYALSAGICDAESILRTKKKQYKWWKCLLQSRHKWNGVRVAFGNGMRPEVWESFQTRFGIRDITEFCKCIYL